MFDPFTSFSQIRGVLEMLFEQYSSKYPSQQNSCLSHWSVKEQTEQQNETSNPYVVETEFISPPSHKVKKLQIFQLLKYKAVLRSRLL